MCKAIVVLVILGALIPTIQSRSPSITSTSRPATTKPTRPLIRGDDYPRFSASLDSVRTNDNGGVTATVTLQNCSTQPFYVDDQLLPRDIAQQIRIWPVDSDKRFEFWHNGCVLYADSSTRSFRGLSPGEKYTVTVELGGNSGEIGDFYEFEHQELPFNSPPLKFLPVGRMAVTLQLGLYVYSSNPKSYSDRLQFQKWVVCQCDDLKWLTVVKTWPQ